MFDGGRSIADHLYLVPCDLQDPCGQSSAVAIVVDHQNPTVARRCLRPSGRSIATSLDPDSGEASEPAIRAAATLTLALPKQGLLTEAGREHAGELYLADIGLPAALYERIGLAVDTPFATGRIVRLEA